MQWKKEYAQAKQEIEAVQRLSLKDTFRVGRNKDIYLVTPNAYRAFISGDEFVNRGFSWDQVKHFKYEYYFAFNQSFGPPLK